MDDTRMAVLQLDCDISSLFPYLNAVAADPELHRLPPSLRFSFSKCAWVLYPDHCVFPPVDDRQDAWEISLELLEFFNQTQGDKGSIPPNPKCFSPIPVPKILRLLPLTNCGECGFPTCLAFAANLGKDRIFPGDCPHMKQPDRETAIYELKDAKGSPLPPITLNMEGSRVKLNRQAKVIHHLKNQLEELSLDRASLRARANESLPTPMTPREIEILQGLARGETNAEMAKALSISSHTVKSHVLHIFNKLGVNHRTAAAVWAARHHFI